jgi:hypothetical protein
MQSLPPALFIVMLELTAGAFLTLYLLDRRGGTSRGYIIFQGVLYFVLALLTYGAMQSFATPTLLRGFGLDAAWLAWQPPLVLAFLLLLIPWNILLWLDPTAPRKKGAWAAAKAEAEPLPSAPSPARGGGAGDLSPQPPPPSGEGESGAAVHASARSAPGWVVPTRHVVGAVTALVGMAAVFAVGMAYRPLADARLGGVFVVAAFVAGAVALGGVMTAMLLGHWYLNTPTASGKPLEFSTILLLAGLVAELAFLLLAGPSTVHPFAGSTVIAPGTTINTSGSGVVVTTPTPAPVKPGQTPPVAVSRQAPLGPDALVWLQYLLGFLSPLVLGAVSLWLVRGRSFQSATGMLYLATAFIFIGEIISRALLVQPLFM